MARKILLVLALAALIGCGSQSAFNPINPPDVHAFSVPPNCNPDGTCSATYTTQWGYCQWQTYQTAKTFVVAMEIGMNSNATPGSPSICEIPFALGGGTIKSIEGNSNYYTYSANLGSLWLDVRSCTTGACPFPQEQEHLFSQKYTVKGAPQSLPIHGQWGIGLPAQYIMIVWNDDLANAKPVTINVNFSGTFQ
jgi:hypothetical protein